ncbi:low specificity L-threonine aldolase [Desulfobaculum bizertense]|uniref:threonine aldolase family protein n=1 Tax=Desulfobaculum bizertense TaxID=376490 RepID=UPI001F1581F1|nr:low specificity L-threonine aldolase [Desulfobaculum bizertense]UIJ37597.1 low specificity L-threonine aldolase [Desulfobaculum bizertense]
MRCDKALGSDNYSGIHPVILEAITAANVGHVHGYGDDDFSAAAVEDFRKEFGEGVEVFFVFNGTGCNVTALAAMLRPYEGIVCADCAHINVAETGAPERILSAKLMPCPSTDAKLTVADVETQLAGLGNPHAVQPAVLSLSQATELGTVYSPEELRELTDFAHDKGMLVHMDGARISNAAAALGVSLREAATGVDVLSFGGTKNGLMCGEAIVFLNPALAENFFMIRKQCNQLPSKMRFISAQFSAFLKDELWRSSAQQANDMAALLAKEAATVPGVEIIAPVESNQVFAKLPAEHIEALQERMFFYVWNEKEGSVRWVCSFDTTAEEIHSFVKDMRRIITGS